MSDQIPCPYCGLPLTPGSPPDPPEPGPAPDLADPDAEPVPLMGSGSRDDAIFEPRPGFPRGQSEFDPAAGLFRSPSSSETIDDVPPTLDSVESFPALDVGLITASSRPAPDPAPPPAPAPAPADLEPEDEAEGPGRTPWSLVLLGSYASAATLGLAWVLTHPKVVERDRPESPGPAGAVALPVSGRQAGLSRKVEPPEPVLAEHVASIGRPLRVGALELTPLGVGRGDVTLQRTNLYGKPETRPGGKNAGLLRLRLRNASDDSVFAPLDQAYLRERADSAVDTFVEAAGGQRIYPFPLAVESEWSIVGQDFAELRPGESREVVIASAPDFPDDSAGPFTWRVRLRTGIGRTDAIAVPWPSPAPKP